jgi:hypothetical protein
MPLSTLAFHVSTKDLNETRLDHSETPTAFRDRDDTLCEFVDRDDTDAQV